MKRFRVIGAMRDKLTGELKHPGSETVVPEEWLERLKKAGVLGDEIETASIEPPETAMKPKPKAKSVGGGWYELEDGSKVRKSELEGD